MSFILEVTKKGKDTLLYNNYKYRESYSLKNGDIVWKCLGRSCKASVTTDPGKTAIFLANEVHKGPHPVTMRTFTPTPPRKQSTTETSMTLDSTPVKVPLHLHSEVIDLTPATDQQTDNMQSTSSVNNELLAENVTLKEELHKLRGDFRAVLDHSIDSDQRLLEFTTDIFPPPPSKTSTSSQPTCTYVSNATQTEGVFEVQEQGQLYMEKNLTLLDNLVLENDRLKYNYKVLNDEIQQLKNTLLNIHKEKEYLEREIALKNNEITSLSKQFDLACNKVTNNQSNSNNVSVLKVAQAGAWDNSRWLDDTILQSYYEAFSSIGETSKTKCLFLGPSITQLLKHGTPDVICGVLNDLLFYKADFTFCCVSNSTSPGDDDSGSHWSLLVLDCTSHKAYHFDSSSTLNIKSAQRVAENLGFTSDSFVEVPCIQQSNSFECGINVLVTSKIIFYGYCLKESRLGNDLFEWYSLFFKPSTSVVSIDSNIGYSSSNSLMRLPVRKPDKNTVLVRDVPTITQKDQDKGPWKVVKIKNKSSSKTNSSQSSIHLLSKNKFSGLSRSERETSPSIQTHQYKHDPSQSHCFLTNTPDNLAPKQPISYKPKVKIFSDSHGRGIRDILQKRLGNHFLVTASIKPSAKFKQVIEGWRNEVKDMSERDHMIIIGGTNNLVSPGHCNGLTDELDGVLRVSRHTRVLVVSLPLRFDQPSLIPTINSVNGQLSDVVTRYSNASLVSLSSLGRKHYTRHGLHLGWGGKRGLVELLGDIINLRQPRFDNNLETRGAIKPGGHNKDLNARQETRSLVNGRIEGSRVYYNQSFLALAPKQFGVPWTDPGRLWVSYPGSV